MLCSEIIKKIEATSPTEYAMDWDNVGLLVGRATKEVKKILLAVDATEAVVNMAVSSGVDMIITHHPMIFSKIKKVNSDSILGDKILTLAENGICCYAMHTNYDTIGGMAKEASKMMGLLNSQVLEETMNGEGFGEVGILPNVMALDMLAENVKNTFGIDNVLVFGDGSKPIEKVAICPGSGKSFINQAISMGAECLITGDIGHHDGVDAVEAGLTIIDASHYGVEKLFLNYMYGFLKDFCQAEEIIIADTGVPYHVV